MQEDAWFFFICVVSRLIKKPRIAGLSDCSYIVLIAIITVIIPVLILVKTGIHHPDLPLTLLL